jgi:hypothetical protein
MATIWLSVNRDFFMLPKFSDFMVTNVAKLWDAYGPRL